MDMVPLEDKIDKIAQQSLDFFDAVSSEQKTPKQLAKETGLSLRTVYNRINAGREFYETELRKYADKLIVDVKDKYDFIWVEAKRRWQETQDVNYLKEMRSVLEAYRKMFSLDNAPKSAVNPDGTPHMETLVLVFDDSEYNKKEEQFKQQVIAGTYTISADAERENGTTVLLPSGEDVVK